MAEAVTKPPILRAIRNPTPVRDLARGIAFEGLARIAQIIQDPEAKDIDAIKAVELVLKYSLGIPSPAEQAAIVGEGEVQEAKTLALLQQALRDPGMREYVRRAFPGLLREADSVPEVVDPSRRVGHDASSAAHAPRSW